MVLFGQYTHGGIYPAFLSQKLFVQFGTFVSRVKLWVLECSTCQITECPVIVITQKTQVKSEFIAFMYRAKTISQNFSMTHGIAWKWQFPVLNCQFLSYTPKNTLEFYFYIPHHAWKWKFWVIIFCTTTQNFFKPTKAFNLANIVQACPACPQDQ